MGSARPAHVPSQHNSAGPSHKARAQASLHASQQLHKPAASAHRYNAAGGALHQSWQWLRRAPAQSQGPRGWFDRAHNRRPCGRCCSCHVAAAAAAVWRRRGGGVGCLLETAALASSQPFQDVNRLDRLQKKVCLQGRRIGNNLAGATLAARHQPAHHRNPTLAETLPCTQGLVWVNSCRRLLSAAR